MGLNCLPYTPLVFLGRAIWWLLTVALLALVLALAMPGTGQAAAGVGDDHHPTPAPIRLAA